MNINAWTWAEKLDFKGFSGDGKPFFCGKTRMTICTNLS